jgi:CheY-like chemotaxis protein
MRRLKILIVEDDDDLRALYSYMLAAGGYKVKAVRNGLEALAEIQVNRPDVIVTDIIMPGLSGLDLIVAVRSNDELADLPVVAITSFGERLREEARAAASPFWRRLDGRPGALLLLDLKMRHAHNEPSSLVSMKQAQYPWCNYRCQPGRLAWA